ncbi:MAG: L,D-transpeptidase, partial [Betaproteobacteria bacterium]|nr:L,D-transpeptidase [Betaproteobacteria bacterium]
MNSLTRGLMAGVALLGAPVAVAAQNAPENLLPDDPAPVQQQKVEAEKPVTMAAEPVVQAVDPMVQPWQVADAQALVAVIKDIGSEGLDPADYGLAALQQALAAGPGPALDAAASQSFAWLVEDLRDGRTPMSARVQWFVVDPDPDLMPTGKVMADALASHDIAGSLAALNPTNPDYARLRGELAKTSAGDTARRKLI